jgi:DNA processing protein
VHTGAGDAIADLAGRMLAARSEYLHTLTAPTRHLGYDDLAAYTNTILTDPALPRVDPAYRPALRVQGDAMTATMLHRYRTEAAQRVDQATTRSSKVDSGRSPAHGLMPFRECGCSRESVAMTASGSRGPAESSGAIQAPAGSGVRLARAWLSRVFEPGDLSVHRFIAEIGPAAAVAALQAGQAPAAVATLAAAHRGDDHAEADLALAAARGMRLVTPEDYEWPAVALQQQEVAGADGGLALVPPLALWVCGSARLDEVAARAVAIVGDRDATSYGTSVACDLANGLARRGWSVVSGGGHGVDTACLRGALAGRGTAMVVFGSGLCQPYPASNSALFERVAASGLLVSEWPPDVVASRQRLLGRSRLIAGLARGTIMVEAGVPSGARVVAGYAADLGRPVMAVPGPTSSKQSTGVHELIREGHAVLAATVDHVIESITGDRPD